MTAVHRHPASRTQLVNPRALSARTGTSALMLSLALGGLSACGGSSDGDACSDYRSDVNSGSAQDTRDIANGDNPCY